MPPAPQRLRPGALGLLILLGACSTTAPPKGAAPRPKPSAKPAVISQINAPAGGRCNPDQAQWAQGQAASARIIEQARVRANARWVRLIHPGEKPATDFDAQRLSLKIDPQGKVQSGRCE